MIEASLSYDGDILESVQIKRGGQVRPLWQKLEQLSPENMIIWVDRFDSLCPIASEWALAQAFEASADVRLPKRAHYVRSILCEINRLVWLTTYLGRMIQVLGQRSLTQQIFFLREQVFVMQEELTGGRILPQALCLGGCRRDLAVGDVQKVRNFIQGWRFSWEKWVSLMTIDPLIESRLTGLLPVSPLVVEKLAWWGVVGKASGVSYDARKHRPHGAYYEIDFELPNVISKKALGDAMARFQTAIAEVNLSLHILDLFLKTIPNEVVARPAIQTFQPGLFSGYAESAKGPVIAMIDMGTDNRTVAVKLFSTGQRVWPAIDSLFKGIRAEDFELAFASLGIDPEEAEL